MGGTTLTSSWEELTAAKATERAFWALGRGRGGVGTSQGLPREKEGTWPLFAETSDQLICILYEFSHLVTLSSPFWGRKGPKLT